mgnify:CR=1 FL=1
MKITIGEYVQKKCEKRKENSRTLHVYRILHFALPHYMFNVDVFIELKRKYLYIRKKEKKIVQFDFNAVRIYVDVLERKERRKKEIIDFNGRQ